MKVTNETAYVVRYARLNIYVNTVSFRMKSTNGLKPIKMPLNSCCFAVLITQAKSLMLNVFFCSCMNSHHRLYNEVFKWLYSCLLGRILASDKW